MPESSAAEGIRRRLDALWRIEGARIVASLARATRDVGLAEDLAQEAVADALAQWPESGVPANPGAWLTAVAKRKAIDAWRRAERLDEHYRELGRGLAEATETAWQPVDDDVLRLVFIACHPVLSREAQLALTLRIVGGLTTEDIARLFLVSVPTVQQRIVRAKRTLAAARVPFEPRNRTNGASGSKRSWPWCTCCSPRGTPPPPGTSGSDRTSPTRRCGSAESSPGWFRANPRPTPWWH